MALNKVFGGDGGGEEDVMPSYATMQLPTPLLKYGQQGTYKVITTMKRIQQVTI
jgi:hypothetical protein